MARREPKPRKTRSDSQGLARVVTLKISDELHAEWTAAAQRQGQSLGAWIREAAELALARGSTR